MTVTLGNTDIEFVFNFCLYIDGNMVLCSVGRDSGPDGIYFPRVNNRWTEDKENSFQKAVDSCLKYLGVPEKERPSIITQVTRRTQTDLNKADFTI